MNAILDQKISPYTLRLVRRPSFLEGIGRLFDFFNLLNDYNYDESESLADSNALRSDWYAVGDDLRKAMQIYDERSSIEQGT